MAADLLSLDSGNYDPTQLLVQFRSNDAPSALIGNRIAGATVTRQLTSDGWFQLTLDTNTSLSSALSALQNRSDVAMASPDFKVHLNATPNDPSYASQWALENGADADIDASQAWNYGTSSNVVVAVIDTGVDYNHVDLVSNIWTNSREVAGNGIDDDRNGYVDDLRGWNFVANNNNPMDDNGHGTHVAGTIGAVGNNGIGVSGIAWSAKIMALKFMDASGSGDLSDAVAAIDYARVNGAKIINASWGSGDFSSVLQSAISRFQSVGGIFVAAAGNESANNAQVASYPANYALSNVISVAASSSNDTLASFSNYGTNVDIAAPGVSILSTVPGNRYDRYSGTSMATPHVAGAFALLWGQNPNLTATQLMSLVTTNTDPVLKDRTIHGRLNVGKAAAAAAGNTTTDTTNPYVTAATWNQSASGVSSVDVTFSEAVKASTVTSASFQLTGPSGAINVASVTAIGSAGNQYRVSFTNQTGLGTYTLTVLPTITDNAGNRLDQDRDGNGGETTQDRFVATTSLSAVRNYTNSTSTTIADATSRTVGTTLVYLDITEDVKIGDLNVNLSIDHTYVSDLRIRLLAPDGTAVTLVNRRGGSRDNIRVLFDDSASSAISSVTGNLSGTFRSETALSTLAGKSTKGRWTLEIIDNARIDTGRFNSMTLQVTPSAAATAKTVNPLLATSVVSSSVMGRYSIRRG